MRNEQTFRFTLSFPRKTAEQIRVGELLERMGNKKSRFIIHAIHEYIEVHPELLEQGSFIRIQTSSPELTQEKLRELIAEMLAERDYISDGFTPEKSISEFDSGGVEDMLNNLDVFFNGK